MIQINKLINSNGIIKDYYIEVQGKKVLCSEICEKGIFLDLEHYVYKKPIGIVVFGACTYDKEDGKLHFLQYMMESKEEKRMILSQAEEFFKYMHDMKGKKYIITFSGNNDFLVLRHLFKQEKFDFKTVSRLGHIDLQKEYEKAKKKIIGLKRLENYMDIQRESEVLNGAKMARTFGKMFSRANYRLNSMKKDKLLKYNQQDVISLYRIMEKWDHMILKGNIDEKIKKIQEEEERKRLIQQSEREKNKDKV